MNGTVTVILKKKHFLWNIIAHSFAQHFSTEQPRTSPPGCQSSFCSLGFLQPGCCLSSFDSLSILRLVVSPRSAASALSLVCQSLITSALSTWWSVLDLQPRYSLHNCHSSFQNLSILHLVASPRSAASALSTQLLSILVLQPWHSPPRCCQSSIYSLGILNLVVSPRFTASAFSTLLSVLVLQPRHSPSGCCQSLF